MGFVILMVMTLYLFISIGVVFGAVWYARKHGKSTKRWGWSAAFVMYLIPFWDWIPTVAMHQYYCATQSGFWVYKTLDQWKAENPGVAETLVANDGRFKGEKFSTDHGNGKKNTYFLNNRFNWIVIKQDISNLLPIIRTEQQVIDVKKNEILARYVDFGTGNSVVNTVGPPGPLKFWMKNQHCRGGDINQDSLRNYRNKYMGVKK